MNAHDEPVRGHEREDLEARLQAIKAELAEPDVSADVDRVEGLLREQQVLELRLSAFSIAAQKREKGRRTQHDGAERAARISTLRTRHTALTAELSDLEQQQKSFITRANLERPDLVRSDWAWQLPESRRYVERRGAIITEFGAIETELAHLEGETERAPLPA